jgi:DNA-directed RNA polymerase specialized sigma24 family protein
MLEKLKSSLILLNQAEMELIKALFYDGVSEREWSAVTGIPQKTINDRKQRILNKLKKLLEN